MTATLLTFSPAASTRIAAFSHAAGRPKPLVEKELKLITSDGSSEPFFMALEDLERGRLPGIAQMYRRSPVNLIALQFDTPDGDLRHAGISLRMRGTYTEAGCLVTPDLNIKTGKVCNSVHMSRGEYEARLPHARHLGLGALERKYAGPISQGRAPDLVQALRLIKRHARDLTEKFMIDYSRVFTTVKVDLGLGDDKQFYGEFINDDVSYRLRLKPDEDLVLKARAGSAELEVEPIRKPCEFNYYTGCEEHVCRNLDDDEEDRGLALIRDRIIPYGDILEHPVANATSCKSERCYEIIDSLKGFLSGPDQPSHMARIFSGYAQLRQPAHSAQPLNIPFGMRFAR